MSLWSRRARQQRNLNYSWIDSRDASYNFLELCKRTEEMLEEYTGQSLYDSSLTEDLRSNQEEHRRMISNEAFFSCNSQWYAYGVTAAQHQ